MSDATRAASAGYAFDRRVDTVVLGGGPAGAACARELARAGVPRVLLVEPDAARSFRIGESVPPEIRPALDRLGLLEPFLAAGGHDPCLGSVSIWGDGRTGYNDFLLNPRGHGWHLDRARFDAFLLEHAGLAGAEVLRGWRLQGVLPTGARARTGGGLELALADRDGGRARVHARCAVDATGVAAVLARQMGARWRHDDRLICLSAVFPCDPGMAISRLTRLEAAAYGWWYAARLPGGRLLVALTSDAAAIRAHGLNDPAVWRDRLADTALIRAARAGWPAPPDGLRRDPAPSGRLDTPIGANWLACGDAALAFDPLMSDGIRKALASGIVAAEVVQRLAAGEAGIHAVYRQHLEAGYAQYRTSRQALYDQVARWPEAAFWAARQTPAIPPPVPGPDVRAAARRATSAVSPAV